jgi:hypothetical protein
MRISRTSLRRMSIRYHPQQLDWLPKVLTQKGDFLGFEFCRSRGSFATVPAMESRFLRCSSVADIHLSTLRSDYFLGSVPAI